MKTFEFNASAGVTDVNDTCFLGILGTQSSSVSINQPADSSILVIAKLCARLEPFEGGEDRSPSDRLASLCCPFRPGGICSRVLDVEIMMRSKPRGELVQSREKPNKGGV
jgi:hypothetical protein